MTAPPPYPRTPYLWAPDDDPSAETVDAEYRRTWLERPVLVEEKLDGANVSVWLEAGRPRVASRGGPDAMDRGRQLGPLRAWASGALDRLAGVLRGGWVLYGEWLWMRHTVTYTRLPEPLVALDLYHPESGFAAHGTRSARLGGAGLTLPPRLFRGVLGSADRLVALLGRSRFGDEPAEGAVLRGGDHERCKIVRPGFVRAGDDTIGRARNTVVPATADPARDFGSPF